MKTPFKEKYRVTQIQHSGHEAMDLVCDGDWNVVATEDGVVTTSQIVRDKSNLSWTYGNYVKYRLDDGTYILCAHLSTRLVKKGDKIKKGQVIGVMGSTGNSTGAHLHIEHRAKNGSTRLSVPSYLSIANEKGNATPKEQNAEKAPSVASVGVGDTIKILSGAVYTNGVKVPSQYIGVPLTVSKVADGRVLIKELYSWVQTSYIKKGDKVVTKPQWVSGAKVKINKGAVYTNGVKVPSAYIGVSLTIQAVNDSRALIQELYSWVDKKYLTLI